MGKSFYISEIKKEKIAVGEKNAAVHTAVTTWSYYCSPSSPTLPGLIPTTWNALSMVTVWIGLDTQAFQNVFLREFVLYSAKLQLDPSQSYNSCSRSGQSLLRSVGVIMKSYRLLIQQVLQMKWHICYLPAPSGMLALKLWYTNGPKKITLCWLCYLIMTWYDTICVIVLIFLFWALIYNSPLSLCMYFLLLLHLSFDSVLFHPD